MPAAARAARLLPQPCTPNSNTPFGAIQLRRAAVECRLALQDPAPQALHAADVGELRRVRLRMTACRRGSAAGTSRRARLGCRPSVSAPSLKMAWRARRSVSATARPARLSTSFSTAFASIARHRAVGRAPIRWRHAHRRSAALVRVRQPQLQTRGQVLELLRHVHSRG